MHALDMGNMGQAAWNTLHGHWFAFTNMRLPYRTEAWKTTTRLSFHVEALFPVISLTYLIYPHPESLLILQTLAIAGGAIPVYLLARDVTASMWVSLTLAGAYLLFPALEAMSLYEFHPVALATSTGRVLRMVRGPDFIIRSITLDENRHRVYGGSVNGKIAVFDSTSGDILGRIPVGTFDAGPVAVDDRVQRLFSVVFPSNEFTAKCQMFSTVDLNTGVKSGDSWSARSRRKLGHVRATSSILQSTARTRTCS